jgi:hypothetical protein
MNPKMSAQANIPKDILLAVENSEAFERRYVSGLRRLLVRSTRNCTRNYFPQGGIGYAFTTSTFGRKDIVMAEFFFLLFAVAIFYLAIRVS